MEKRGQLTAFIIIGIIIVVGIGIAVYVNSVKDNNENLPPEAASFKVYIDDCLKETLRQGIIYTGFKGGYYYVNNSKRSIRYLGDDTPYYFYEKESFFPGEKVIENEIGLYVEENIYRVCNITELRETSKDITFEDVKSVDVKINYANVNVNLNMPVSIAKEGGKTVVSEYSAEVPVRLGKILSISELIVALNEKNPYSLCLSCINEIRGNNIYVKTNAWYNNSFVFELTDNSSLIGINKDPYKFYFAAKYIKFSCDSLPEDIDQYIKDDCEMKQINEDLIKQEEEADSSPDSSGEENE